MKNETTVDSIIGRAFGIETETLRTPVLSDTERRAYQAAWRIRNEPLREQLNWTKFACKSTRESREIERVAKIIQEEMGR